MDRIEARMDTLEQRMDYKFALVQTGLENISKRLDAIEISTIEQKHEKRIRRIEKHLRFAI